MISKVLARLKKSSFIKNIFVVMSGTALAQILSFALSPIISRLYSPAEFGVYGSFTAVLGVIAAGLTLDYSQALMLPKEKGTAINLFFLSLVSTLVITTCCFLIFVAAPTYLKSLTKSSSSWILALLVLGLLATGSNQSLQAWCVRVKAFKHTSASQVIRSLSTNGTQIGLGLEKWGSFGLITASILGNFLASLNLARVVYRDLRDLYREIHWQRMWQLAKDFHDFPKYSASINVINALSMGLPVLLLSRYYGIAVAGAYAFGMRILSTPMGLILGALRQVLYQKASESHAQGSRLLPLYIKISLGLFALAFFPSLALFIWAPQIFTLVFGPQWHTAGLFARSLILWQMFMFCNLPAVLFVRIVRMQHKLFVFDITVLAVRSLVLIAGGIYLSALSTVMLFSVAGAILNIVFIIIVGKAIEKIEGKLNFKDILTDIRES